MTELKPCPFCGGSAKERAAFASGSTDKVGVYVECEGCGAWSKTEWGEGAEKKAADAWNTRPEHVDRDALLALADEIEDNDVTYSVSTQYVLDSYASRIREALGVKS